MNHVKNFYRKKKIINNFFPTKLKKGVRLHEPTYNHREINAVLKTLYSTRLTFGPISKKFEKNFSKHFKTKNSIFVNSGSSANLLAFSILTNPYFKKRMKPGDEVIVPALSWSTSVWPIIQMNLKPVFVDIEKDTMNIDPKKIEAAITKKTKCIMVIHTYGNPCNMDEILKIKKKHNLFLIEDTCESIGSKYKNKFCGTYGDIGTYSFYFSHHITTGEGGMIVTKNDEIAKIGKMLRAHGWVRDLDQKDRNFYEKKFNKIDRKFLFANVGYNIRGSEIGASMGIIQLKKLNEIIRKRSKIADFWKNKFSKSKMFKLQKTTPNSKHSWFGIPILINKKYKKKINDIRLLLDRKNIETRPIICGNITRQPALKKFTFKISGSLLNSDMIMSSSFAIGCHQNISNNNLNYANKQFSEIEDKYA